MKKVDQKTLRLQCNGNLDHFRTEDDSQVAKDRELASLDQSLQATKSTKQSEDVGEYRTRLA